MKMMLDRECIRIVPENVEDEVYLEAVLGLKLSGPRAEAVGVFDREPPWGQGKLWAIEVRRPKRKGDVQ
jgi:hypothetical protein